MDNLSSMIAGFSDKEELPKKALRMGIRNAKFELRVVLPSIRIEKMNDFFFDKRYHLFDSDPNLKINIPTVPIHVNGKLKKTSVKINVGNNIEECPVYRLDDRKVVSSIMVSGNYQNYDIYRNGVPDQQFGGECINCKSKIPPNIHPVGIPLKMNYNLIQNIFIFHIEGRFCDFSCGYSYVKEKIGSDKCLTHPLYDSTEKLFKLMFSLMYPNDTLIEAPDPSLLNFNNGPFTDEQYHTNSHTFTRTPNIHCSAKIYCAPSLVAYDCFPNVK